jgi:hypothetical protein
MHEHCSVCARSIDGSGPEHVVAHLGIELQLKIAAGLGDK